MPSLNEYITTLRKYNPGITDRAISVYLLKDGWKIEEIEKTFAELNAPVPPAAPVAPVVQAPAPFSTAFYQDRTPPTTSSSTNTPPLNAPVSTPPPAPAASPVSVPTYTAPVVSQPAPQTRTQPDTLAILTQLANAANAAPETSSTTPGVFVMPTPVSAPTPTTPPAPVVQASEPKPAEPIAPVPPAYTPPPAPTSSMPASTPVSISQVVASAAATQPLKNQLEIQPTEIAGGSIPHPTFAQVQTKVAEQHKSSLQAAVEALVEEREHLHPTEAAVKPVVPAPVSAAPSDSNEPKGAFGDPVATLKPKFSYDEIMQGPNSPITELKETPPEPQVVSSAPSFATAMSSLPMSETPVSDTVSIMSQASNAANAAPMAMPTSAIYGAPTPAPVPNLNPEPVVAQKSKGSKIVKFFVWLIVIAGLLYGLGFAYFKFVHGIYLFANEPIETEHLLKGVAKSFASMETAEYTANITLGAQLKEGATDILELDKLEWSPIGSSSAPTEDTATASMIGGYSDMSSGIVSVIPSDASITGGLSGVYDRSGSSQNGKVAVTGSYVSDAISVGFDVEALKIENMGYIRLNKFPTFLIDLSSLNDKWISVTGEDLGDYDLPFLSLKSSATADIKVDQEEQAARDTLKKQLAIALDVADTKKVFEVIGSPERKKLDDGRVVYEYSVKPNLQNLIGFFEQIGPGLKVEFGDKAIFQLSQSDIDYLKSEAFAYYFNYLTSHSSIIIGIDTKGRPAYIHTNGSVVLKSGDTTKQLNSDFKIDFKNVNEKISVEKPAEAIPYIEAYSQVTGKSKEHILFERQIATVEKIRDAIVEYKMLTGEVPAMILDLNVSSADLVKNNPKALNPQTASGFYFATSSSPLYSGSAKDAYSDRNLAYQKINNDEYRLTYSIGLPLVPKSSYDLFSLTDYDYDTTRLTAANAMMYLRYVNGINTATDKTVSVEADAGKAKDTDKDKITDSLESFLGTNVSKADTDSDGTNDYLEVRSDTNPKGQGDWEAQFDSAL